MWWSVPGIIRGHLLFHSTAHKVQQVVQCHPAMRCTAADTTILLLLCCTFFFLVPRMARREKKRGGAMCVWCAAAEWTGRKGLRNATQGTRRNFSMLCK
jgi:hypothetical protein